MIPADEIYHILQDLKKLRQERGYTKSEFVGVNKKILALAKDYHWRKDELIGLIEEKERFFDYEIVHKEIKIMKSLLKFISKLLKKKEFVAELADIEQFKKAIRFNELKLKALDGRNKECLKTKKVFEKIIKMKNGEFEKYLSEWDSAQAKVAYVDRLEDGLEKKVMVEQARKFPESVKRKSGVWKTASAYAVAAMIGFGAITADYSKSEGISFGGGNVYAQEVVHDLAFYEELAQKTEDELFPKKAYGKVIELLKPYAQDKENKSALFYNNLGVAYKRKKQFNKSLKLLLKGFELDNKHTHISWNLGQCYYHLKDYKNSKKFFQLYIDNKGKQLKTAKDWVKWLDKRI
ncbi:MAG: hypothetical protein U9R34_06115 [Nanoarchaeota archaeon]|nr:hypothetical protein [Nanoarchaeota archaeon]